jgi:hypothetical protein
MKNHKSKPRPKEIKELAIAFNDELQAKLPITRMPNGSIVYKDYLVKETKDKNWGIYRIKTRELVEVYFLKTCALMAAKAYSNTRMEKYFEIKRLDNQYWANYSDTLIFTKNIKTAKDYDRYLILLNRLEHSKTQAEHFKEEISRMFKWSFV